MDVERAALEADEVAKQLTAKVAEMGAKGPKLHEGLKELIEDGHLGERTFVQYELAMAPGRPKYFIAPFKLTFYCAEEKCGRDSEFHLYGVNSEGTIPLPNPKCSAVLNYVCRFCDSIHSVMLRCATPGSRQDVLITKVGEWPRNHAPLSKGLLKLAGSSRDLLKQGYQAELEGFGVGSFAYYRRVVEELTDSLLKKIREVAVNSQCSSDIVDGIDAAIADRSHSRSLELAKESLPPQLLQDGKNPLSILHNTVSVGLHSMTDAECLEHAEVTRELLEFIVDRLDALLKEPKKLREALGKVERAAQNKSVS